MRQPQSGTSGRTDGLGRPRIGRPAGGDSAGCPEGLRRAQDRTDDCRDPESPPATPAYAADAPDPRSRAHPRAPRPAGETAPPLPAGSPFQPRSRTSCRSSKDAVPGDSGLALARRPKDFLHLPLAGNADEQGVGLQSRADGFFDELGSFHSNQFVPRGSRSTQGRPKQFEPLVVLAGNEVRRLILSELVRVRSPSQALSQVEHKKGNTREA